MTHVSGAADRRQVMARGAVDLVATDGVHGLTHRGLDRVVGLPEGSTSNVFPGRVDLLRAALGELVGREMLVVEGALDNVAVGPWTIDFAAEVFTNVIEAWLQPRHRNLLIARYTLMIEASRSEELAPLMISTRSKFTALVELFLAQSDIVVRTNDVALQLVAWADGVLVGHIVAPDRVPSRQDIRRGVERLLTA